MIGFILRALLAALGLWIASKIVPGIVVKSMGSLLAAGVLLGIVNAIVRPIVVVLTLPFTIITLGLFLLVVNGAMLGLVSWFLGGFQVHGFWAAVFGAIVVSLTGWVGSWFIGSQGLEARG
ncbi:hypothetical protein C5708_10000 [Caulobacter sp. CCUG 60055]|uniref:phage holin family protein n=1 Tax=Caulobacter sp. CCUG 60055 TaxID=2100090 RepID=UPI001FA74F1D|nr:phage holin family protein [Caulobacter sp. CCUG 60055]MBQ1543952.1 phage holin family protein [Caulobacteraceae bacterium]MCI3180588.1 hypothetical protein [Caulobacter sp. CCUG 60055]